MAHSAVPLDHIDQILDRQQRLWELEHAHDGEAAWKKPREGPWLAISTQLGAFGREIAERLAKTLQWQLFDKEILTSIVDHATMRERVLVHDDERGASGMYDYLAHLLIPGHLSRASYEVELMRVVSSIGRRGSAVLFGRGAQFVLDPAFGLRVRILGDRGLRIDAYSKEAKIAIADAARRIDEDDAARRAFVRQVFRREIDDPLGYDLVVNGPALGLEAACRIVLEAYQAKLGRN